MFLEMLSTGNPQGGQVLGSVRAAWWSSQVLRGELENCQQTVYRKRVVLRVCFGSQKKRQATSACAVCVSKCV